MSNLPDESYVTKCILCHSCNDLVMVAHRIDGYLVGWILVCRSCFHQVIDKEMTIEFKNGASQPNERR